MDTALAGPPVEIDGVRKGIFFPPRRRCSLNRHGRGKEVRQTHAFTEEH